MYYRIKENKLYDYSGYEYADDVVYADIDYETFDSDKYIVSDGVLVGNPDYEAAQAQKERERVAMLKMTKLDFFKFVVAPTGKTYAQLLEAVGSNDLLQATWDLCNHVYRGDEVMNTYATDLLGVSKEQLDEIFKERGE